MCITEILLILLFLIIFYSFILIKLGYIVCHSNVCLKGKIAVVTGGSSGLGYEIVLKLASRGCRVIIADKIVNEDIKKAIVKETHNKNIVLEYVDFASFQSVRNFAKKLNDTEPKLDILINNVGMGICRDIPTEDGLNKTMQVNYYSPFLLTHLLIDLLRKSESGRIIFTGSLLAFPHVYFNESVIGTEIKDVPSLFRFFDYPNSKFLTVVASDIFAESLQKFKITSNVWHPGVARTNIFRTTREQINFYNILDVIAYGIIHFIGLVFGIDPKKASQAALVLAVSNEYKNVTGLFFGRLFPNLKPRLASDQKFCETVWRASEHIVHITENEKLRSM